MRFRERPSQHCANSLDSARLNHVTNNSLLRVESFDHFYALYHEIAVISPAALLAYHTLARFGEDRRSDFRVLENVGENQSAVDDQLSQISTIRSSWSTFSRTEGG